MERPDAEPQHPLRTGKPVQRALDPVRAASPLLVGWVALATLASCGGSVSAADGTAQGADESAKGNQAVFSGIDVHVVVSGFDEIDYDAREPSGAPLAEPPIEVRAGVRVEVNGATAVGRVPGLRVFAEGTELEEIGSAGFPQQFSFQHYLDQATHGQRLKLEFRYDASMFTLSVYSPTVELTRPAADERLTPDEPLTLEWSGIDAVPELGYLSPRGGTCAVGYMQAGETTFVPVRNETGEEPPCRFELSADWQIEMPEQVSPFRSLRSQGRTRRIQRFNVQ